jgi:superfamily II DNA or RNA helicase
MASANLVISGFLAKFYAKKFKSWSELESAIADLQVTKEIGDAFELFAYFFLKYHASIYQIEKIEAIVVKGGTFSDDITARLKLESKDNGVDGVFLNHAGEAVAYQVKFRTADSLSFRELATFWSEAENADRRLVFSNCSTITDVAAKKRGHLEILRDKFEELTPDFFEALSVFVASKTKSEAKPKPKTPHKFQEEIIDDVVKGFRSSDRGKIVAACGVGKTLVSLWITERRTDSLVLFLAPSLQLIRQTLGVWAKEANAPFSYLCVCSDETIALEEDEYGITVDQLDIPVTTSSQAVRHFINGTFRGQKRVVFATYQSVSVISKAVDKTFKGFDIIIFDEAHRTAGAKSSVMFAEALDDERVPSKKRLFMTATERILGARAKAAAAKGTQEIFSMDDVSKYGPVFHKLSFGRAIKLGIISDYRIVFACVTDRDVSRAIKERAYVSVSDESGKSTGVSDVDFVYRLLILEKCIRELGIKKTISFHDRVPNAKRFAGMLNFDGPADLKFVGHVNGSMPSSERRNVIKRFEDADTSVLTNVRCLSEGVDVPQIDAVYFTNPKSSVVDIVQAVGRAMRQPYGHKGKVAYIIVPLLVSSSDGEQLNGDGFDSFFDVVQAMRDQDEVLAETIDELNYVSVQGRKAGRSGKAPKVVVIAPTEFDKSKLTDTIFLKIADVNSAPTGAVGVGSKLKKTERISSYTRVFKTLADYTISTLSKSLIDPTIDRFSAINDSVSLDDLKINNNNISHCRRLGLIIDDPAKKGTVKLTYIGKLLKSKKVSFPDVFKNQMLIWRQPTADGSMYPYRLAFQFLREKKSLSGYEFIYGLYSITAAKSPGYTLDNALRKCQKIRGTYPNIEMSSESSKQIILDALNADHPYPFPYNDVWTDRTTTWNQYRYIASHLLVWSELFISKDGVLKLAPGADALLDKLLQASSEHLDPAEYGNVFWLRRLG